MNISEENENKFNIAMQAIWQAVKDIAGIHAVSSASMSQDENRFRQQQLWKALRQEQAPPANQ